MKRNSFWIFWLASLPTAPPPLPPPMHTNPQTLKFENSRWTLTSSVNRCWIWSPKGWVIFQGYPPPLPVRGDVRTKSRSWNLDHHHLIILPHNVTEKIFRFSSVTFGFVLFCLGVGMVYELYYQIEPHGTNNPQSMASNDSPLKVTGFHQNKHTSLSCRLRLQSRFST